MLICKVCGGSLVIDESFENAVCKECGIEYPRAALQRLMGTQSSSRSQQPVADSGADRLAANGETYMNLKEYAKATDAYQQLVKQYPDDWRGWWGCFHVQINTANFRSYSDFIESEKCAQNAFRLAGSRKDVLIGQYNKAWDLFNGFLCRKAGENLLRTILTKLSYNISEGKENRTYFDAEAIDANIIRNTYIGASEKLICFLEQGHKKATISLVPFASRGYRFIGDREYGKQDIDIKVIELVDREYSKWNDYSRFNIFMDHLYDLNREEIKIFNENFFYQFGKNSNNAQFYNVTPLLLHNGVFVFFGRNNWGMLNRIDDYKEMLRKSSLKILYVDDTYDLMDIKRLMINQNQSMKRIFQTGKCPFCGGDYSWGHCTLCFSSKGKTEKYLVNDVYLK